MARAEPISQHGWFPDPEEPGRLRMWDGKAWTSLTKYPSAEDVVTGPAPSGPLPVRPDPSAQLRPGVDPERGAGLSHRPRPSRPGLAPHVVAAATATPSSTTASSTTASGATAASTRATPAPVEPADATPGTLFAANTASVITLGLALVCIIAASVSGYAVIAVVPALVALRAFAVREPMAAFAGLAGFASLLIGLVLLAK